MRILINESFFPREDNSSQLELDRVQFLNTLKIMSNNFICSNFLFQKLIICDSRQQKMNLEELYMVKL